MATQLMGGHFALTVSIRRFRGYSTTERDDMSDGTGRPERPDRPDRPRKPGGPRGRDGVGGRGAADRAGAGKPRRDGEKPAWRKDGGKSPRRDAAGGTPWRFTDGRTRPPRDEDARPRHDDPPIPDDVAANQLDKVARGELRTLSKDNADGVAKHLIMAGRLIDEDPALAHRHALAAARRAGRVGVVRETVAITAYAIGDFALALRELRTHRRITGSNDQLPLMVDSERGVGRADRALELGRSVPRSELDVPVQVALAIAMSGARLDLGQPEAALTELQIPQLDPERAFDWSPALFDAYATVLEELGRDDEAAEWIARSERATEALVTAADPDGGDIVEIIEEGEDIDSDVVESEEPDADPRA